MLWVSGTYVCDHAGREMARAAGYQQALFPALTAEFPSTRYQGSKAKLVDWIWAQIGGLHFTTCLDAFGGTGAVAYRLRQEGKPVTYNDLLRFNYFIGKALIENDRSRLGSEEVSRLLRRHPEITYPSFAQDTFSGIYYTDEENAWIDQTITNIRQLGDPYEFALAFFALCQACIVKRPYNLFHRKNLYMRFAEVDRSFGNKTSGTGPSMSGFASLWERRIVRFSTTATRIVPSTSRPSKCRGSMIWYT